MKYIYYSITLLFITAPLSYADKKSIQGQVVLKTTNDKTNPTANKMESLTRNPKKIENPEQLINYLQHPGLSKEQQLAAAHLFEKTTQKTTLRDRNTQEFKQFCNHGVPELALFANKLSELADALVDALPEITSNDQLADRIANGDKLTQEDLEFISNIYIVYMHDLLPKKFIDDIKAALK